MKLVILMLHPPTVQIITKLTVEELRIQIMSPFRNQVLRIIGLLRHETLKGKDVVKFKISEFVRELSISHSVPWFLSEYSIFLLFSKATSLSKFQSSLEC